MLRKMLLAVCSGALMAGLLAVPTSGEGVATVFDLNGIPGTKLDICIAGVGETVSNLPYGRVAYANDVPPGTYRMKVRVAAQGTCKGRLLYAGDVTLEADKNYTLVYWKPARTVKIRQFENDVSLPAADAASVTLRHTAKAGTIDAWVWQQVKAATEDGPTFDDLRKGGGRAPVILVERQTMIEVFPARKTKAWGYEYVYWYAEAGNAYQAYLIGTERRNYRVALLVQPGVPPVPAP